MFKKLFTLATLLTALLLASCTPATSDDADEAKQTLVAFFDHLSKGDYASAAALYGGDHETLVSWNPDLDPTDHAALWERGCLQNGLQCLTVRSATFKEQNDGEFIFTVEFNNPDGSLFVLGPCCGATETEMPPVSLFEYCLAKTANDEFKVMDLPVYVP